MIFWYSYVLLAEKIKVHIKKTLAAQSLGEGREEEKEEGRGRWDDSWISRDLNTLLRLAHQKGRRMNWTE